MFKFRLMKVMMKGLLKFGTIAISLTGIVHNYRNGIKDKNLTKILTYKELT